MRITCTKDQLAERLALAARGTSTRATMQIAAGVLIDAADAERPVELHATDMELSMRVSFPGADIEQPGRAVIPARLGQEIVRALPAERVVIEHDESSGRITITAGSGSYQLQAPPAEDFPRLPVIDHERELDLDGGLFTATLNRVVKAASRDESRPVLTGVALQLEPGRLTMAATDSYRLAVKETVLEQPIPEALEAIVPARALQEVDRMLQAGGSLTIVVEENHVAFGTPEVWLTARRIEGKFPDFRALVPDQFSHEITLPRAELGEVARRIGIFAQHGAPVRLRFEDGSVTVSARTPDVGEAQESLPAPFQEEAFEIGFNAEYLRDGIDAVGGDELRLQLINPLRPALLRGAGEDFWYLLMPIRLG